jgi:hypothetical protein
MEIRDASAEQGIVDPAKLEALALEGLLPQ